MTDTFDTNFGGYADVTEIVAAASQTAILAQCALFKALIPDPTAGVSASKPDFDRIDPELATKLRAEFDLLTAAIDAAPTS